MLSQMTFGYMLGSYAIVSQVTKWAHFYKVQKGPTVSQILNSRSINWTQKQENIQNQELSSIRFLWEAQNKNGNGAYPLKIHADLS